MSFRDKMNSAEKDFSRALRHMVRRRYLRNGIKHYGNYRSALTSEQRKAAKAYWSQYTKHFTPLWHEFYTAKTGLFDVRYIPEDIMFTEIEGYFNEWDASPGLDNKCNYTMLFPEIKHPKTAFRYMHGLWRDNDYNIISKEQAIQNCKDLGHIIIKIALESGRGEGVDFWQTSDGEEALRKKIDSMPGDLVATDLIVQHPALDAFQHSSINCIRVVTLATEDGIKFVCAYLRMGQGGRRVDWLGGCCCSVNEDGTLRPVGYDNMSCDKVLEHEGGIKFEGLSVPSFDRVKETAFTLHKKIGAFRLISWDFSVDPNGNPVFIEMNLKYGGTKYHQLGIGPLFGDKTDAILDEVYGKNKR